MIHGKVPAIQKPTALGTLLQASTYGMAIPRIFGTTKAALLAIWAQNLRQGKCRGKKYKGKKKGTPNYVENIDFLIGSNPIDGVLQSYLNGGKYALNFIRSQLFAPGIILWATATISDPQFYMLLAVTVGVKNTGYFNDFGHANYNGIGSATVAAAGSGYAVNDTFGVNGTSGAQAIGTVTAIGAGGAVTAFTLGAIGSGYSGGTKTTTAITGVGAGLTVNVNHLGVPFSDISEYPLFNRYQAGPDFSDGAYHKFFPWTYYCKPGSNVIEFDLNSQGSGIPADQGAWIYYAQLSSQAEFEPPVTAACLTFESQLGNGPEYSSPKDFTAQRIIYPEYAGAGSPDIDLGAGAMIPQINLEVRGTHPRWHPRGDADFADMIEDIVKSGVVQTGQELGLIQGGANCNDLPGTVQKACFGTLQPTNPKVRLPHAVAEGSLIFVACTWNGNAADATGDPTISDTAGLTWTKVISGQANFGLWYATATAAIADGDIVTCTFHGSGGAYDSGIAIWVMDPASDTIDASATQYVTALPATLSLSVTTTGSVDFLVAIVAGNFTGPLPLPTGWKRLFPNFGNNLFIAYRAVRTAATYSFSCAVSGADPVSAALFAVKSSQPSGAALYPKALGNILDKTSLDVVRAQCQAAGLIGSLVMNSQRKASDWLKDLFMCANADPVWSGFVLKSIAKSEQSAVGNGRVYTAPTASGPVATLTEPNLVAQSGKPMIAVSRKAQTNADNTIQAQFYDRNSDYNPSTASEPLGGAVAILGPRKGSPQSLPMIQDPAVARMILAMQARRWSLLRNTYKFAAKPNFAWLEAGDVVAVNDSKLGISNLALRLTSTQEQDDGSLACEADLFVYGCNAPNPGLAVTAGGQGYSAGSGGDPGSVNAPIFIECVPRLSGQSNQEELWIPVSGSSDNYGGCVVMISTDGGASYNPAPGEDGSNAIQGSAITGVTTADWPAANDPDTVNNLAVDLTESLGTLETFAAADRDNFTYPCYVAGGSASIPYELMAYDIATLTSANKYTLQATGGGTNDLRRGVFGAPGAAPGIGVDHPLGSRFCFLGNPKSAVGVFKMAVDPSWIGKTLYFKFLAFNTQGNNLQAQSAATAYSFAPTGLPGASQNPNQNYSISGGALTQPTSTTIDMAQATAAFASNQANYNARVFTIPAPGSPITYYVTIYDPAQLGDTGSATNLSAFCDSNTTRWNTPGYVRIGSITAVPAGGASGGSNGGSISITVNGN